MQCNPPRSANVGCCRGNGPAYAVNAAWPRLGRCVDKRLNCRVNCRVHAFGEALFQRRLLIRRGEISIFRLGGAVQALWQAQGERFKLQRAGSTAAERD